MVACGFRAQADAVLGFGSTCSVGGRDGLVLVEAKAHFEELHPDDRCTAKNPKTRNESVRQSRKPTKRSAPDGHSMMARATSSAIASRGHTSWRRWMSL
jgi:hypothetical protein